jgi:hypothetical protein
LKMSANMQKKAQFCKMCGKKPNIAKT